MAQTDDRSIRVRNVVIGIVVLAAIAAAVVWGLGGFGRGKPPAESVGEQAAAVGASGPVAPTGLEDPDRTSDPTAELERRWTEAVGSPPVWPEELSRPQDCTAVRQELDRVCAAIDVRTDAELRTRSGGACHLFEQAGRDLALRPPENSAELRSYESILANVFHLFRVLGRERLQLLKRTLEGQRDLAEPLALAGYRWLASREQCARGSGAGPSADVLYEYAGFVFNTMGGQAYLRRRSPRVEALACFYALQVVDRSVERGRNPHGLDPRPEIGRCLALVRSQDLLFADRYADELGRMARRWDEQDGG